MLKFTLAAFLFVCLILVTNCQSQKKPTKSANQENPYLVVSFYSPGNGIDVEAFKTYKHFLEQHKDSIRFEVTPWGREGEVDVCILLGQVKKQNKFIRETKNLLETCNKVHVNTKKECSKR